MKLVFYSSNITMMHGQTNIRKIITLFLSDKIMASQNHIASESLSFCQSVLVSGFMTRCCLRPGVIILSLVFRSTL